MGRRLVKHGESTLMVSLPSKWLRNNNLKKGNEVDVKEKENELIISRGDNSKEKTRTTVNIGGLSPLINRSITALYKKGVDELEIRFENKAETETLQKKAIPELLGFEILKQSQNSILIKDITGPADHDLDEIIRRIFLILDSMAEELINTLDKKLDTKPVIDTDASVNKFVNFSQRILNKKGYKQFQKTSQIYSIMSSLEEIGDLFKYIALEFEKDKKIDKNQIEILTEIRESLDTFRQLFFNFDKEKAVLFAKNFEKLKQKIKQKSLIDYYLYDLNISIVKMINDLLVISI